MEAFIGVTSARIAIATLPFHTLKLVTKKLKRGALHFSSLQSDNPANARQVAAAIEQAGRYIPGAKCLARALAGSVLLARHGHDSTLYLGVRHPSGEFGAHAWLEWNGQVVVGGPISPQFVAFPSLDV